MIYENTIEYIPKDEGLFFISGIDEAKWPSEGNLRSDLGSFDQPVTQRVPSQPDHVQRVSPPFPPRRRVPMHPLPSPACTARHPPTRLRKHQARAQSAISPRVPHRPSQRALQHHKAPRHIHNDEQHSTSPFLSMFQAPNQHPVGSHRLAGDRALICFLPSFVLAAYVSFIIH